MEKAPESTSINIAESSKENKGKAPLLAAAVAHDRAAPKNRGVAIFDLIVRVSAATAALGATVAMGTAEQTLPFFTQFFQFQASYDDLPTFQFFVIAMAIVTGYLFLSVPFSIVCIVRPMAVAPRLLLVVLDTLTLCLTTASGSASAAISYLAHNGNPSTNWLAICQQYTDFCQATSGAVVASFVAVVLIVLLVVISAVALRRH